MTSMGSLAPALNANRSTLEEMLESVKHREDRETNILPRLPQRPTSRARLPSSARLRKAVNVVVAARHTNSEFQEQLQSSQCTNNTTQNSKQYDEIENTIDGRPTQDFGAHLEPMVKSEKVRPMANSGLIAQELGPTTADNNNHSNVTGRRAEVLRHDYLKLSALSLDKANFHSAMGTETIERHCNMQNDSHSFATEDYQNEDQNQCHSSHGSEEGSDSVQDSSCSDDEHGDQPIRTEDSQENGPVLGARLALAKFKDTASRIILKKRREDASSGLKKNSRVWCLNSENKWTLGIVQSTSVKESVVSTNIQSEIRLPQARLLKLASSKLLPANPDILEGVTDLIQLSYLNEPAVLHNLRCRYSRDKIYTRAGPVLIAVNPFKKVPLYTLGLLNLYRKRMKDSLDPHVYMTTESAYGAMMKDGLNQAIIISGESGAGKTETAKIAMHYLAAVCGGGVENEILQTNPILEAFGNAKTVRNDNSSRFGKLIDIYFEDTGKVCGAKIQTYLLEKSRVVQQAKSERTYHVFYQLCAGANAALRDCIHLKAAKDYRYLKQSGCLQIDNVDDAARFSALCNAMDVVQISKEDQDNAFAMLSAILWLGNITFKITDNENHVSVDDNEAIEYAAKLLKCSKEHLMCALSTRRIRAGNENIVQKLTHSQAVDSRDALAKAIYAGLFDWLVDRINKSLEVGKCYTSRSIIILDIYGFESFEKNSFEQLCINYANERLQQYFNRHLFKIEQEEYISEGIDWTRVEFEDNQDCLDLIEKRPLGLISLLDEECTFPKGTDYTLAEKLKEHLIPNICFKGERSRAFRIRHYAGEVIYDTLGFLEKNRDVLHSDLLELLASCEASLPRLFAHNIEQNLQKLVTPYRRSRAESQKQSVATKFKGQLSRLMQRLENTEPHFIRCIKPNASQQPNVYEDDLVLQQLRCCGVLEVVRISKSGYPTRITHQNFASRYGFLLPLAAVPAQDVLSVCVAILHQFNVSPDMYQVGYTKLFFRAGQIGRLEDCRTQTLHGIVSIQKIYRGYKARCEFKKLKMSTILVQSFVRGKKARKEYDQLWRRHRAAIMIQKFVRGTAARRHFRVMKKNAILIQSASRGWLARRKLVMLQQKMDESRRADVMKESEESDRFVTEALKSAEIRNGSLQLPKHVLSSDELKDLEMDSEGQMMIRVPASVLAELQSRVLIAEVALKGKEEDNAVLRQRLNHYEIKWSEYEAKMSSMEEMWQKQMSSLQASLAAAKKSLAGGEELPSQTLKYDDIFSFKNSVPQQRATCHILPHDDDDFDWDDNTSVGTKTPDHSNTTPRKPPSQSLDLSVSRGELDAGRSIVSHLIKEFEHRGQVFYDDTQFLVEVKSGQTDASLNPDEELRKLKQRFDTWKKDFKVRLRDTKYVLQKLTHVDPSQKMKKIWWGKKTTP